MTDTNNLIRTVAFDIISITTIWALINSHYGEYSFFINIDNKYIKTKFDYMPIYGKIMGMGASFILLRKYYS
jgi:hypothetical protein